MPGVNAILETAIYVSDLKRSVEFYQRVFGFQILMTSDRLIALDVAGRSVLLLFKIGATSEPFETPGGIIPNHGASGRGHFAFSINSDDLAIWRQWLEAGAVGIESVVKGPMGGVSIYFRDPDNHLVELLTPGVWRTY